MSRVVLQTLVAMMLAGCCRPKSEVPPLPELVFPLPGPELQAAVDRPVEPADPRAYSSSASQGHIEFIHPPEEVRGSVELCRAASKPPAEIACKPPTKLVMVTSDRTQRAPTSTPLIRTVYCAGEDGRRHGPTLTTYSDGTAAIAGQHHDGWQVGTWRYWSKAGHLLQIQELTRDSSMRLIDCSHLDVRPKD